MANRSRVRLSLAFLTGAIALGAQSGAAAAATDTPCGPAPAGYNIIISNEATISGTAGDDFICAGNSNNEVWAGEGDDIVHGRGGDDALNGDDGDDVLLGGPGQDRLSGGVGDDRLNGGANNDDMVGGPGNDVMHGRRGNDSMIGGRGNDRLRGGLGRDSLIGGDENDILQGNAGWDLLWGGNGRDRLDGRRGQDHCVPAARVVSCENPPPTDHGIAMWDHGETYPWATVTDLDVDNVDRWVATEDGFVVVVVWADESRTTALFTRLARNAKASGGWFARELKPPSGAVIDVFDTRTGRRATMTYELQAAAVSGGRQGGGVLGQAASGVTVEAVDHDLSLETETATARSAAADGSFFVPIPDIGTRQHTIVVTAPDPHGNETSLVFDPVTRPLFSLHEKRPESVIEGLGGWTPLGLAAVELNGSHYTDITVDADGSFRYKFPLGFDIADATKPGRTFNLAVTDIASGVTKELDVAIRLDPTEVIDANTVRLSGQVSPGVVVTHQRQYVREPLLLGVDGSFEFVQRQDGNPGFNLFDGDGDSWESGLRCYRRLETGGNCSVSTGGAN